MRLIASNIANADTPNYQAREMDFAKALRLRRSLGEMRITTRHGLDLIDAFKQDAVQSRYQTWDDLIGYCLRSACPVGRYLLDLHGESPAGYPASDALCNALQVLNHLQDCRDDHRSLDRVYLPLDWMAECGTSVDELQAPHASQGLRDVIDRALDRTDELLLVCGLEVPTIKNVRLSLQTLELLSFPPNRIRVILNRANSNVGIKQREVEGALEPGRVVRSVQHDVEARFCPVPVHGVRITNIDCERAKLFRESRRRFTEKEVVNSLGSFQVALPEFVPDAFTESGAKRLHHLQAAVIVIGEMNLIQLFVDDNQWLSQSRDIGSGNS